MKNIVIAAGYATRLGELTKNFPKPLLKIGENTILGRMLDDIDRIPEIDEHIIITNHKFASIFEQWAGEQHYNKPITIIDDGTETNEMRLGAVCDLLLAINGDSQIENRKSIDDDLLVVAADNLLFFSFQEFVDFARAKGTSCIMCHEQPSIEKLQRTGVVELDEGGDLEGERAVVAGDDDVHGLADLGDVLDGDRRSGDDAELGEGGGLGFGTEDLADGGLLALLGLCERAHVFLLSG